LHGIDVWHSVSNFELGQEMILTLADKLILQQKYANVTVQNSTIDSVLENINLTKKKRSA